MTASEHQKQERDPASPIMPIRTRAWWHRNLEAGERRRVLEELAITRVDGWGWRFTIMLSLSVVVAVMGLSADSAAVVIGAMLLAPLMTPVLATAATLSMSLTGKAMVALAKVVGATLWCVAVAYLLSSLIPEGPLASEVEARTRPDIRDLAVALAAGAAGAYATVRRDASSALPGVAVAVALVPPLATVGITLEAGKLDLALGALLLYITNLAAIVFAGVMVFIATGFVPPRRLSNTAVQLVVAFGIALSVVVVVAVPLYSRSMAVVEDAQEEVVASRVVSEWLNGANLSSEVDVSDNRVRVRLRGFEPPPDEADLKRELEQQLGSVVVLVEWVRTERATTTTAHVPTGEEILVEQAQPVVEEWLQSHKGGSDWELTRLRLGDGVLRVDAVGADDPPPVDDLLRRLHQDLDPFLDVSVNWTTRKTVVPGTTTTLAPEAVLERQLGEVVARWATEHGVTVDSLSLDGDRVRVNLIGSQAPVINPLIVLIQSELGGTPQIEVTFIERQRLTTTVLIAPGQFGEINVDEAPTTTRP